MKRILCYGDSNTYGCDTSNPDPTAMPRRYDENTRWTALLQKKLGFEEYRVIEEGLNGRTTVFDDVTDYGRNGYTFLEVAFSSHDPLDLIIVMLGTNDLRPQHAGDAFLIFQGMRRIIIRLKELIARSLNPDAKILLLAPPKIVHVPGALMSYKQEWIDNYPPLPKLYEDLSRMTGCYYANTSEWTGPGMSDGLHLDPDGHRIFAEKLEPLVREIIG